MSTPRPHEKWCKSMPREFDAVMGRGPYECDCAPEGVAAPLEPSQPEIAGLRQWESDTGKPASCSEGNAYMDGFRDGKNHAAVVSKNLQEELAALRTRWNFALKGEDEALRECRRLEKEIAALREKP